jgi:hypothetical protein
MKRGRKLNIHARIFARKAKRSITYLNKGFGQEYDETKDMAKVFFNLLEEKLNLGERETKPTEEEVKKAIGQLKDIGRLSVFTSISLIPGGGFSLIGLEILARKFGIKNFTFIPSAFRGKKDNTSKQIISK